MCTSIAVVDITLSHS
uniref:Leader peptide of ErmA n=1 Tax=Enterococcus faecalis TaxID=1351 RepID=A0A2S1PKR3_ENTFL|nr:peptide 1 [Enterococcus faecalis]AWH59063.1 leader peptide of ermA1 [Enterococcus faecalis]AWH59082.1 peptide 1 [Enterococcus faecalis]AWH59092.1 Leader peptide of ErmA [Enterococcus faecalis]AWH59140.1 Leader peptide of ErmA [Enterococcus faecalis]